MIRGGLLHTIAFAVAVLIAMPAAGWAGPKGGRKPAQQKRDPLVTVQGEILDINEQGVLLMTESGVIELPKKDFENIELRPGARYNLRLRISDIRAGQRTPAALLKNKQRYQR